MVIEVARGLLEVRARLGVAHLTDRERRAAWRPLQDAIARLPANHDARALRDLLREEGVQVLEAPGPESVVERLEAAFGNPRFEHHRGEQDRPAVSWEGNSCVGLVGGVFPDRVEFLQKKVRPEHPEDWGMLARWYESPAPPDLNVSTREWLRTKKVAITAEYEKLGWRIDSAAGPGDDWEWVRDPSLGRRGARALTPAVYAGGTRLDRGEVRWFEGLAERASVDALVELDWAPARAEAAVLVAALEDRAQLLDPRRFDATRAAVHAAILGRFVTEWAALPPVEGERALQALRKVQALAERLPATLTGPPPAGARLRYRGADLDHAGALQFTDGHVRATHWVAAGWSPESAALRTLLSLDPSHAPVPPEETEEDLPARALELHSFVATLWPRLVAAGPFGPNLEAVSRALDAVGPDAVSLDSSPPELHVFQPDVPPEHADRWARALHDGAPLAVLPTVSGRGWQVTGTRWAPRDPEPAERAAVRALLARRPDLAAPLLQAERWARPDAGRTLVPEAFAAIVAAWQVPAPDAGVEVRAPPDVAASIVGGLAPSAWSAEDSAALSTLGIDTGDVASVPSERLRFRVVPDAGADRAVVTEPILRLRGAAWSGAATVLLHHGGAWVRLLEEARGEVAGRVEAALWDALRAAPPAAAERRLDDALATWLGRERPVDAPDHLRVLLPPEIRARFDAEPWRKDLEVLLRGVGTPDPRAETLGTTLPDIGRVRHPMSPGLRIGSVRLHALELVSGEDSRYPGGGTALVELHRAVATALKFVNGQGRACPSQDTRVRALWAGAMDRYVKVLEQDLLRLETAAPEWGFGPVTEIPGPSALYTLARDILRVTAVEIGHGDRDLGPFREAAREIADSLRRLAACLPDRPHSPWPAIPEGVEDGVSAAFEDGRSQPNKVEALPGDIGVRAGGAHCYAVAERDQDAQRAEFVVPGVFGPVLVAMSVPKLASDMRNPVHFLLYKAREVAGRAADLSPPEAAIHADVGQVLARVLHLPRADRDARSFEVPTREPSPGYLPQLLAAIWLTGVRFEEFRQLLSQRLKDQGARIVDTVNPGQIAVLRQDGYLEVAQREIPEHLRSRLISNRVLVVRPRIETRRAALKMLVWVK